MELKAIDYTLIIITLLGVIFLAYRFMIYLGKVRSAPGYAKRKIIGFLFLAFISLTGIIPLFRDSLMNALNLPVPQYFTEYSFGAFVVLAIAAVLIVRNDKQKVPTTKIKQSNKEGDNIAGDKVGNDKIGGDKIGGDKTEKKEVWGDEIKRDKIVHIHPAPRGNDPKKLTFIQKINPDELVGRKNDLEKLHQLLTEKKKVVVVNGMGGIGKTTLAAAYTFQFEAYYQKIVWITQSQEDITNDFVQNQELIHSLNIETEGKQADLLFAEILHALINIPEKPKLLVIDNALEGLEAHLDKLPSQPAWDLLVTSREAIEGLHTMPLDFLSEAEAITLFQKHCSRISDTEAIKELVNTVEFHTLTIEILAKTAQKQRTEPEALKKALETDLKANVKTAHSQMNQIERVASYLGTIFDFSTLSEDEIWLLKNFCALPAEFHPYKLLLNLIDPEKTGRQELFAETLENLAQKGWLLKDDSGEQFRMHRVIGETGLNKLEITVEDIDSLAGNITNKLYLNETKDNPVDKFQWIPFGLTCLKTLKSSQSMQKYMLQTNCGLRSIDMGNYPQANFFLEQALQFSEKTFGKGHKYTSQSYSNLGVALSRLGEYDRAKSLLEKAISISEQRLSKDHPEIVTQYSNLGEVFYNLGNIHKARELAEKALILDQSNFGESNPKIADRYSNLGAILYEVGSFQEARQLLERAIHLKEKQFGQDDPRLVISYSLLGSIIQQLGELQEAKIFLIKAVKLDEKFYGVEHPRTANRYTSLAAFLMEIEEYFEAKEILEKVTLSDVKNYGREHPITAQGYFNLATALLELGELQNALKYAENAFRIFAQKFPQGHPRIDMVQRKLNTIIEEIEKNEYY